MPKADIYRATLPTLTDWDAYLLKHSGLPGPRANLELVQVAADLGTPAQFRRWVAIAPEATPAGTPTEFLPMCGAVGLGRLLAEGDRTATTGTPVAATTGTQVAATTGTQVATTTGSQVATTTGSPVAPTLRALANDPRWRVREAVAMALQRWGEADLAALVKEMGRWVKGTWLEQRAAAAGLCEPRLLRDQAAARRTLKLLDTITRQVARAPTAERKTEAYKALRQGLAYCWSVAAVALPAEGLPALEAWLSQPALDPDVRWIMQENLKKNRLSRLDPAWVQRWRTALAHPTPAP